MSKQSLINIRGNKEIVDFSYRYKMEEVILIKHGAAQLAFTNIDNICSSLSRDVSELLKFLKKYFGSSFDYKNNIVTTFKKDLTKTTLQEAIYQYIENNVLCKKCKNPETIYIHQKKKMFMTCKACSHTSEI